jgi:hypothetical protein
MSIYRVVYDRINKSKINQFEIPNIESHVPKPIDTDYTTGYITRYFIQKSNDKNSVVREISKTGYQEFINNSFYTVVTLDWKISGTAEEIKEANLKSVKRGAKTLPAVQLYLPYLLQFSKQ